MTDERPDFDNYFLQIALAVSARGDCTRSQVGAVLVDSQRIVVATGYNGVLPGQTGCLSGACPRGLRTYDELPPGGSYADCIAYHAEVNTISFALRAGQSDRFDGATMYVTRDPCFNCRMAMINVGINRAVTICE